MGASEASSAQLMPGRTSSSIPCSQSWDERYASRCSGEGGASPTGNVRETQKNIPSIPTVSVST